MLIVTCASLSGGQGKSTVALFLSRKLASLGYSTVAVDADPQNNLTTWLGVELDGNSPSLLEVLKKQVAIEESLYFVNDHLYVLPSDDALIQAQEYLSMLGSSAMVLRQRLKPIATAFQFCIIDSPPQQTQICLATVGAADALVIPAEASLKGFNSLVRTLALVDELTEIGAFTGIIVGALPFRDKWIGFSQTLKSRRSIEAMADMGTPVLPSVRESDQFEKAINQKVMLADLGHEDLEYPFQVLVQKLQELKS